MTKWTDPDVKPPALPVRAEDIPADLRAARRWVVWCWDWPEDADKWTKPPYQVNGVLASSTNPATWTDFDTAFAKYSTGRFDGVGFVLTDGGEFFGIDIDDVLDPDTGELKDDSLDLLLSLDTYVEVSPSGTGLRAVGRGKLPDGPRRRGNREAYDAGRYLTFTGHRIDGAKEGIRDCAEDLPDFYQRLFPPEGEPKKTGWEGYIGTGTSSSESGNLSDDDVLRMAKNARNGSKFERLWNGDTSDHRGDDSVADLALLGILRFYTQDRAQLDRLFRQSGLMRAKWDKKHFQDGRTYGTATIDKALSGTFETWTPSQPVTTSITPATDWPNPPNEGAFYGLAGDIVRTVDPYTEADPVAVLVNVLAAFGTTVGPAPHFMVGATSHPARTNFALVGKSGKSRKGDSQQPVSAVFRLACPEYEAHHVSGLSTGEGLIAAVRDRVEREVIDKKTGLTTLEVVDEGVADKRLHVVEPELARVLRVLDRQGNTLSAVLRDAWDFGSLSVMTKQRTRATNPHITVIGHITVEELRRELSSTSAANGLANRFAWLAVKRSKELARPEPFEGMVVRGLADRVAKALRAAEGVREMDFSTKAGDLWEETYHELSADRDGLAGAILNRSEAHTLRLSMIYALLDGSEVIEVPHLVAALALWEYAERSAYHIFGDATGDPKADAILAALMAAEGMSRTEIRDMFGRHGDKTEIDNALARLLSKGSVRSWTDTSNGGRPAEMWAIT